MRRITRPFPIGKYLCAVLARLLAAVLIAALLLPVGQQAWLYGWYALDNEAFTLAHCRNWEATAPMCFGSCKIMDAFVSAAPSPERLVPSSVGPKLSQYCQLPTRAGAQVLSRVVAAEWTLNRPAYFMEGHGRLYVGSVFWPPAG